MSVDQYSALEQAAGSVALESRDVTDELIEIVRVAIEEDWSDMQLVECLRAS